jgi:hypothetical protein
MEHKDSYAAKRKKNQEKRACPENYNIYLYISHQGLKDKHTYIIS